MANVVLKRVGDKGVIQPDPRSALMMNKTVRKKIIHQAINIMIVRMSYVYRKVPCETLVIAERSSESSKIGITIIKGIIVEALLLKSIGGAEPTRACADN